MDPRRNLSPLNLKLGQVFSITRESKSLGAKFEVFDCVTFTCLNTQADVMHVWRKSAWKPDFGFCTQAYSGEFIFASLSNDWDITSKAWTSTQFFWDPIRQIVMVDEKADAIATVRGPIRLKSVPYFPARDRYTTLIICRKSRKSYFMATWKTPPWQDYSHEFSSIFICDRAFKVLLQIGCEDEHDTNRVHVVGECEDLELLLAVLAKQYLFATEHGE